MKATLAERVRLARRTSTQREMAAGMGVTRSAVAALEQGIGGPTTRARAEAWLDAQGITEEEAPADLSGQYDVPFFLRLRGYLRQARTGATQEAPAGLPPGASKFERYHRRRPQRRRARS